MDEKLTEQLLEGNTYEQATVNVRRTFPFTIDQKILIAPASLALAVLFAPLLYYRRALIAELEGANSTATALTIDAGSLAFGGVISVSGAGVLLLYLRKRIQTVNLDPERARRVVRVEDLLMWVLLQGGAFILIAVAVAAFGVVAPESLEGLYQTDVRLYQRSGLALVDARIVSALGGALAVVMAGLWATTESAT